MRGLRDAVRRTFPEFQLVLQLIGHLSSHQMRSRMHTRDPRYEEAVISSRLQAFLVEPIGLSSFQNPNQDVAGYISLELARVQGNPQSYTLYIAPRITDAPCPATSDGRAKVSSRWRINTRLTKHDANPQALPLPARLLYQPRFLVAAEMVGAIASCGGLVSQTSHLTIALNMETLDSAAVAMAYGRPASEHLGGKNRARSDTAIGDCMSPDFSRLYARPSGCERVPKTSRLPPAPGAPMIRHPVPMPSRNGSNLVDHGRGNARWSHRLPDTVLDAAPSCAPAEIGSSLSSADMFRRGNATSGEARVVPQTLKVTRMLNTAAATL